ncbi:DUF5682 family protein [Asticcacaulis sp. AC402]|uniref:DUF5682 family protein n=1 Tax=Asticcacaulis sp. AC402 TaxID=1282361 RepID=UPI0003C40230|nr:DUF5682 family protein [Asticcacaulis sp. AC402]ESQ77689.1 hypothetical protein ABAC402_00745 [Asticcacaulis sp. AC402]
MGSAHLFGIRHHGPGSAALLKGALEALDPVCVLIEGPPEGDALIPYAALAGMKPPVAMLLYAADEASNAMFDPFAEFSPEWVALQWALAHKREVKFIDWPAAVSLAHHDAPPEDNETEVGVDHLDPLDMLAQAAGYGDGEAFWNGLIEHHGGTGQAPLEVFAAIAQAMTETRAHQAQVAPMSPARALREQRREAFMRQNIRDAVKRHDGDIAVVVGAWHIGGLLTAHTAADDKAITKDLTKIKVEATWAPWSDSRLSYASGYGAGVISPGWYRHLWGLYSAERHDGPEPFAARWQARTAALLRDEGYPASTASAIEAARLSLGLSSLRGLSVPGLTEMRDATLSALCHGDEVALGLIERKLYIGERIGAIDKAVPQNPLQRDFDLWCRKTRLKPEELDAQVKLDLRSEAGLLKSTFLHRLDLIRVPWGKLIDAEAGRGTFREIWTVAWTPSLAIALAEALVWGVTVEQAAAGATISRAAETTSVGDLAELVRAALVADLPDAATLVIDQLQAAAVHLSDMSDLMTAVPPLVRIVRYGTARKLPEDALRALIVALSGEINAGVRTGSHQLDDAAAADRVAAMRAFDESLRLFGDFALLEEWQRQLARLVDDDQVAPAIAGLALRRLHDMASWDEAAVTAAFSRHILGETPARAGAFVESFLTGSAEVLIQDQGLLLLIDAWLCDLEEEAFTESLPLLRRALSGFDTGGRKRLMDRLKGGRQVGVTVAQEGDNPAFERALPLLKQILGVS